MIQGLTGSEPAMNKLPNSGDLPLPGQQADIFNCKEPATIRLEIYIPTEGQERPRLDSVAYYCDRHAEAVLEVISWDTGDVRVERTALTDEAKQCGDGFDFAAMIAAYEVGREIGEKSVEAQREMVEAEIDSAMKRIDDKLIELRELKARHAFTPSRIDGTMDDWLWQCTCGEQFIQLGGERIHATLTAHAKGVSDDDAR